MIKKSRKNIATILIVAMLLNLLCSCKNQNVIKNSSEENIVATKSKIDYIRFVGDIYFSTHIKRSYEANGINGIIDEEYLKLCRESDICVGNLECAICDGTGEIEEKEYNLYTPEKYLDSLKEIGFDIFTVANNHVLDFGEDIFLESLKALKKRNIMYIGAGENINEATRPCIKEIEDKKYAIFSASAVIPSAKWEAKLNHPGVSDGYNISWLCDAIKNIRNDVDKIIVYMHWGKELNATSSNSQKLLAHKLVNAGVDLIVGSHPHIPQEIEYYNGVPIVYSLGNFIYGATMRETMMLEASFDYNKDEKGAMSLRIYPGISSYRQVRVSSNSVVVANRCKELSEKCRNCYIDEKGYVYIGE